MQAAWSENARAKPALAHHQDVKVSKGERHSLNCKGHCIGRLWRLLVAQALNLSTPSAQPLLKILSVMTRRKFRLQQQGSSQQPFSALGNRNGIFVFDDDDFSYIFFATFMGVSLKSGYRRGSEYRPCGFTFDAATISLSLRQRTLCFHHHWGRRAILLNWYMPSYRQEIELGPREEIGR